MKHWQLAGWAVVGLVGMGLGTGGAIAGETQGEARPPEVHLPEGNAGSETGRELSATTVADWVAQIEASLVQITAVRIETTEAGLQLVLETAEGRALAAPTTQTLGNALIADIPNTVLALPGGGGFEQFAPAEGIALVIVTNEPGDRVRVAITGTDAPPVAAVTATGLAVTLGEAVVGAEDDAIQVVVTGEQDGYRVPNSSVGTRTDTPLRDIPQTIQVVPQEVLRDQNATRLGDAIRNIPGASQVGSSRTDQGQSFYSRGFGVFSFDGGLLRDGLRDQLGGQILDFSNIERVEALRGPASVLYGRGNPGGVVNLVTKQPLRDPSYAIDATIGSFDFYRGAIDLSGPLNDSGTVLYRINAAYQDRGTFVDRFEESQFSIAPVVSFEFGENTRLTLEGDYINTRGSFFFGLPAVGTVLPNPNGQIPRNRNTSEGDQVRTLSRIGYRLEHQMSNNWSLQNAFRASFFDLAQNLILPSGNLNSDDRTLDRGASAFNESPRSYELSTYFTGDFSTGSVEHQLVFGVDLSRVENFGAGQNSTGAASPIDVFNPVYGQPSGLLTPVFDAGSLTDALGIYVQDQVTLAENLKLLLSGRFDIVSQTNENFLAYTEESQSDNAFSPRVGIVYQPTPSISLYASYSRSFNPTFGRSFDNSQFQPQRGTQYEIGVKADVNDQLSATLALYDLTLTNVLTGDPDNPDFSIQTGEQRSRGVEVNFTGEILPGWSIIAGYAYTDARVTKDNSIPVGTRLSLTPENSFNLWTTYEIQQGEFQGLGVGLGLFFVGERLDFTNTLEIPSYLRTDAAIYYNRDQFRAALNFRNLFDVTYFESAYTPGRVFYGEPLAVQATVGWQF